jgi:hypothetical protein
MTNEQFIAKTHISAYKNSKRNIEHLKEKIETLNDRINSTTSSIKEISIQSSGGTMKDEWICMLADMNKDYWKQQVAAERICMVIENMLACIEDDMHRRILRNHYLYNQTIELISVKEHCCYKQTIRIRNKALSSYANRLKKDCPELFKKDVPQCPIDM